MLPTRAYPTLGPVLCIVAIALAACGGGGGSATAGATGTASGPSAASTSSAATSAQGGGTGTSSDLPAPCNALTSDEIKAITGYGVKRSSSATEDLGDNDLSCSWDLDGPAELADTIVVGFQLTGGREAFDARKTFLDEAPDLPGIGDAAIQEEPFVVSAVKGDVYLSLTYLTVSEAEATTRAASLTKAIADDL